MEEVTIAVEETTKTQKITIFDSLNCPKSYFFVPNSCFFLKIHSKYNDFYLGQRTNSSRPAGGDRDWGNIRGGGGNDGGNQTPLGGRPPGSGGAGGGGDRRPQRQNSNRDSPRDRPRRQNTRDGEDGKGGGKGERREGGGKGEGGKGGDRRSSGTMGGERRRDYTRTDTQEKRSGYDNRTGDRPRASLERPPRAGGHTFLGDGGSPNGKGGAPPRESREGLGSKPPTHHLPRDGEGKGKGGKGMLGHAAKGNMQRVDSRGGGMNKGGGKGLHSLGTGNGMPRNDSRNSGLNRTDSRNSGTFTGGRNFSAGSGLNQKGGKGKEKGSLSRSMTPEDDTRSESSRASRGRYGEGIPCGPAKPVGRAKERHPPPDVHDLSKITQDALAQGTPVFVLKKNLANKIFGYLARCEFWLELRW